MKLELAVVTGALLIAGSILFIERWQVTTIGYGFQGGGEQGADTAEEKLFLFDRWTGNIEYCPVGGSDPEGYTDRATKTGHAIFRCGFPKSP